MWDRGEWKVDENRQKVWEEIRAQRKQKLDERGEWPRLVKDLRKPILIVSLENGINISISVDFQLKAMDNKMIDELSRK